MAIKLGSEGSIQRRTFFNKITKFLDHVVLQGHVTN